MGAAVAARTMLRDKRRDESRRGTHECVRHARNPSEIGRELSQGDTRFLTNACSPRRPSGRIIAAPALETQRAVLSAACLR
jgi:hypothetical protein